MEQPALLPHTGVLRLAQLGKTGAAGQLCLGSIVEIGGEHCELH